MIHSLYRRIVVWFWLSNLAVTAGILAITLISGAAPLGRRWLAVSLNLYAQTACDVYRSGGQSALKTYLDHVEASVTMQGTLLGPHDENLSGRALPAGTAVLVEQVRSFEEPRFHFGPTWVGVTPVHTSEGDYIFVGQVNALRRFAREIGGGGLLLKTAAALLAGCLLCWVLARSITAPLRTLQSAARSLGAGDLSVRVSPKIPPRNDELTDLAHEFDRMAAEIETLRNEQHRLLGDISHELRSPLTRLSISTELASRGDVESLGRMRKDITALDQLIEQILTLTRLEMQKQTITRRAVPLNKLLTALVEDADFEAREQGKSVRLESREVCSVQGEAGLLRSCLENVIRNAVRFAPVATGVRVSLHQGQRDKKPMAIVTVADQGRGVPDDALAHLFEPFYRVAVTEEDGGGDQGTGLGLSISERVITLYGGVIRAYNAATGGLVVVIEFPLAA